MGVCGALRRRCERCRVPGALLVLCGAGAEPAGLAATIAPHASGTRPRAAPAMSAATPEVRGPPADAALLSVALPRIKPDLGLNDATLFAVYCFIKNFIGQRERTRVYRSSVG